MVSAQHPRPATAQTRMAGGPIPSGLVHRPLWRTGISFSRCCPSRTLVTTVFSAGRNSGSIERSSVGEAFDPRMTLSANGKGAGTQRYARWEGILKGAR